MTVRRRSREGRRPMEQVKVARRIAAGDGNRVAGDAADDAATTMIDVPAEAGPAAAARSGKRRRRRRRCSRSATRYAEGRGVQGRHDAGREMVREIGRTRLRARRNTASAIFTRRASASRATSKKSKTWYQLAAEQGNASAMHNLAVLFAMGADGVTDNDSAAQLVHRRPPNSASRTASSISASWPPRASACRRASKILQMVRAGRQDRRQGRGRQARRDRQRAAARTAGARPRRHGTVEGQAAGRRSQLGRHPGILAAKARTRPPAST